MWTAEKRLLPALNNRGVGVLPLVLGISVASVVTVAMVSQMGLETFRKTSTAYTEWETNLGNQKALGLGGYFVAHNLVLCREDGWKEVAGSAKCRWGGDLHNPPISKAKFNITSTSYEDGQLVLNILNKEEGHRAYETQLKLDLVDWSARESFRNLIGEIPVWNELSDDDRYMVVMTATTKLSLPDGRTKDISKSGAIRRPIGTPNVQVLADAANSSCVFECESGDVLSPFPECRGPLGVPPDGGAAMITVEMSNLGPGALYKLQYERTTHYNQDSYPGRAPDIALVDAMEGQEVFMPGQKLAKELERKCYSPTRSYNTQTITQVATGAQRTTTTSTTVSVSSTFRALSVESFDLSVSRFNPDQILDPGFADRYNPYQQSTYTPNASRSVLEPKRLGTELPTFEVSSPQETITETTTTMVVRPRPATPVRSGDGDGDGGN